MERRDSSPMDGCITNQVPFANKTDKSEIILPLFQVFFAVQNWFLTGQLVSRQTVIDSQGCQINCWLIFLIYSHLFFLTPFWGPNAASLCPSLRWCFYCESRTIRVVRLGHGIHSPDWLQTLFSLGGLYYFIPLKLFETFFVHMFREEGLRAN